MLFRSHHIGAGEVGVIGGGGESACEDAGAWFNIAGWLNNISKRQYHWKNHMTTDLTGVAPTARLGVSQCFRTTVVNESL